ncbi:glycosyl transferase family 90-domain-containing protein [Chytriomyces sp. MP71]|nr:glycosyl transferase family 90-domain-containing protein [Chytriomyces sp. MP71]
MTASPRPDPAILGILLVLALVPFIFLLPSDLSQHPRSLVLTELSAGHAVLTVDDNSSQNLTQYTEYRAEYVKSNARDPPPRFNQWIQFAQDNGCETGTADYAQLYSDLDYWIQVGSINKTAMKIFVAENSWLSLLHLDSASGNVTTSNERVGVEPLLSSVAHLLAPRSSPITLVVSSADQPTLIQNPILAGRMWDHLFNRSTCLQDVYDTPSPQDASLQAIANGATIRSQHAYFLEPKLVLSSDPPIPVLSQAKLNCYGDILLPMTHHVYRVQVPRTDTVPWEGKQPVLFWHGPTTGGPYTTETQWRLFSRTRLVDWEKKWAQGHPNRTFDASVQEVPTLEQWTVDVGFDAVVQTDVETEILLKKTYPLKGGVVYERIMKFKYLLALDGNRFDETMQDYLASNSVVLYSGIFRDFYNWRLVPWVHYVPVRLDLSDLEEKVQWLMEHDEEAREISLNARTLMLRVNRFEHMQCYTGLFLLEYARLYDA